MTLWILEVSSFAIVDTGICRYLDGTKTVQGSFWSWSCNTTKSYMPSRRPAICSLKVFLRLRNLDDISNWASLASVEYRSHTCTRSRISVCFADCSSSWQIYSNGMSVLGSDSMRLVVRSNLFLQVTWYLPSAAIRSFTQTSRTLKDESYFAACRILLLTFISCMRCSFSFWSCWQKIHCFCSIGAILHYAKLMWMQTNFVLFNSALNFLSISCLFMYFARQSLCHKNY